METELTITRAAGKFQISTPTGASFYTTDFDAAAAASELLAKDCPELVASNLHTVVRQALGAGAELVDVELDTFGTFGFCVHTVRNGVGAGAYWVTAQGVRGLYEGR